MSIENQCIVLLGRIGVPPLVLGTRYLRYSLPLFLSGKAVPGDDMWTNIAVHFGKQKENIKPRVRSSILAAWRRRNDYWKAYLGDQPKCPSVEAFYNLVAQWAKSNEFVLAGRYGLDVILLTKAPAPSQTD